MPNRNSHCSPRAAGGYRRRRRDLRAFLCALLVMAAGGFGGTAAALAQASLPEAQIKAAFLINFPRYVDWPAEAFAETNSPIVVAVLGESEVTAELRKIIEGRTVNGREIVLKRLADGEESAGYHILFVAAAEQKRLPNLLAKLKADGVLTVGESDGFLERGGIINLARRDQRIALEVNLTAADQARIRISSKLLHVARVVKGKLK
jgi:hypothetical protein